MGLTLIAPHDTKKDCLTKNSRREDAEEDSPSLYFAVIHVTMVEGISDVTIDVEVHDIRETDNGECTHVYQGINTFCANEADWEFDMSCNDGPVQTVKVCDKHGSVE